MRFLSLFSGIEACSVAWKPLGWECVECIEAIRSALTEEEFRGYCKGNALKYVWREKHKGQDESLKKAIWYLNKTQE